MTSTGRLRALRGKRLRDLVEEGVRRVLGTPDPERSPSRVSFPLIDSKRPGSLSVEAVRRAEAETFSTRTTIVAALCDVNLLLALVIDKHTHHAAAVGWLQGKAAGEARICRLTQIGLLRLLNSPAVMQDDVLDTVGSWEVWYRLLGHASFHFVSTEPTGLDTVFARFTGSQRFTPYLWTDAYLAAYACATRLTLVTLDRGCERFPGLQYEIL
jgi:uncharacterized protein